MPNQCLHARSSLLPTRMSHPPIPLAVQKQEILKLLRDQNVKKVVLFGKAGVGKTWMAREVSKCAILEHLCYATLWIIPEYLHKERFLVESISLQLSAYPPFAVEQEDVDHHANLVEEQMVELETVKQSILKKLEEMRLAKTKKMTAPRLDDVRSGKPKHKGEMKADETDAPLKMPHLLVVLDDILEEDEDKIHHELNTLLPKEHGDFLKVLVTRRGNDRDGGSNEMNDKIHIGINDKTRFHKMVFLSNDASSNLLRNTVEREVNNAREFNRLSGAVVKGCLGHPGVIVMVAKALNRLGNSKLGSAIEKIASLIESADTNSDQENLARLMQFVYEMLPSTTISNCAWYCHYWFQQHGGIHFNELITYWLMEGYLKHHEHIEEAYHEAYLVLMELIDRGILTLKVDSVVFMESDAMGLDNYQRPGLSSSSCLGLPKVLVGTNWEVLGRFTLTDGMIKGSRWTTEEISTLLIDGARLDEENLEKFFEPMKKLKVLVILNSTFIQLPKIVSNLTELQVLVLRGCERLKTGVNAIRKLIHLVVLEISGAPNCRELDDNLFKEMANIRSINLSQVAILSLPYSLFDRAELCWLILRGCWKLTFERSPLFLEKLEMIEPSGLRLQGYLEKNIWDLKNLQTLDISGTGISDVTVLQNLSKLSQLILSDCENLKVLPALTQLTNLQILDCSSCKKLLKVPDELLPDNCKIVDFSDCPLLKQPPQMSNQYQMLDSSKFQAVREAQDMSLVFKYVYGVLI